MKNRNNKQSVKLTAAVLLEHLLAAGYEPANQRELFHRLHLSKAARPPARQLIRDLLEAGKIVKISRGRLVAAPTAERFSGILQRHRKGFGFVIPQQGGEHIFIPPERLGGALNGDLVEARITRRGPAARLEGELVKVLERRGGSVVGLYLRRGAAGGVVQAFDDSLADPIRILDSAGSSLPDRQVVQVAIIRAPSKNRAAEGNIARVLCSFDDPQAESLIVAQRHGLAGDFPAQARTEAERLPKRVGTRSKASRTRFEDPAPLTIDGETAQDFDDAIAVQELAHGGFRLFVHIADVSHFVRSGSALDEEARRRGTSVYFPGKVLPMFPEELSNGLCSLKPGVDRLVQSVVLELDSEGRVNKTTFRDGIIRSAARLTYTQVAQVLAGERQVPGVPQKVVPMLQAAGRLRELLERRRQQRGSIDFDLPVPELVLDADGIMTGITVHERNAAHLLIEEFMLAANEAVARKLQSGKADCMYRIHEAPDPLKLEVLAEFISSFGLSFDPRQAGSRTIQRLLAEAEGRPEYPIISMVVLRSMKQASYSMEPGNHYGLATSSYCHFTSPIRRYPDLVNHRLLRDHLLRGDGQRLREKLDLEEVALRSTELERVAETAERELLAWKKIGFIEGQEGQRFNGVVTGVTRFGLFVQLTENLVDGLVRVENRQGKRYEYDDRALALRSLRTGKTYRLGDPVKVRLERVDRILRRVDFSLIQD